MKQNHGGDIYRYPKVLDFSANINPYGPPKSVVEAMKKSIDQVCLYPDPGCHKLREALGEKYNIEVQQIILGNGAAELLFSLCQALKPKRALIAQPSFLEYERALEAVECKIDFYETHKEEGFCLRKDILDAITEKVDMLFLCNPGNPTGSVMDQKLLQEILEKCQKKKVYLVMDECFNEFILGAKKHTLMPCVNQYDKLFILKSFTKLYGLPGIRLGYGITSDTELLEKMRRVLQPWNVSVVAQAAGAAALQEDKFVSESLAAIEQEKRRMIITLAQAGYLIYESAANYIFFEGGKQLAEKCLLKGMLIRDCSNFRGLSEGYYRICVRKKWENERLLNKLREEKVKGKEK